MERMFIMIVCTVWCERAVWNVIHLTTNVSFLSFCYSPTPFLSPLHHQNRHSSETSIAHLQSPRHHLPVVPEPAESHPLPGVQPLQVADHQDRAGPAAAHHAGPLPLQHAGLPCQEIAWCLRGCWEDREGEGGQLDRRRNGWMWGLERVDAGLRAVLESHWLEWRPIEEKKLWRCEFIHSDLYVQLATIHLYSGERQTPPKTARVMKNY